MIGGKVSSVAAGVGGGTSVKDGVNIEFVLCRSDFATPAKIDSNVVSLINSKFHGCSFCIKAMALKAVCMLSMSGF